MIESYQTQLLNELIALQKETLMEIRKMAQTLSGAVQDVVTALQAQTQELASIPAVIQQAIQDIQNPNVDNSAAIAALENAAQGLQANSTAITSQMGSLSAAFPAAATPAPSAPDATGNATTTPSAS